MNSKEKTSIDKSPIAYPRGIYEYTNNSGNYGGICLVISGEHRKYDKYISMIQLKPLEQTTKIHRIYNNEVGIKLQDGKEFWVNCGMITYLRRDLLGKMIYRISKSTMNRINLGIIQELGLSKEAKNIVNDCEIDYEKLYNDLIKSIGSGKKLEEEPEEPELEWIPCDEREPEEYGEYFITWTTSQFKRPFISICEVEVTKEWDSDFEEDRLVVNWLLDDYIKAYPDVKVTAWAILPEPYTGRKWG